jgi:transcriptional regulator with XRE-family HTH domain
VSAVAISADSEWKANECGQQWTKAQASLALIGAVSEYQELPASLVARLSFNACLTEAARHGGLEDQQLAEAMHISAGYMSKFMRGVAQHWARRMVVFMRTTRSLAPLQWMANELGADIVRRAPLETEVERLKRELAELRRNTRS